MNPEKVRSELEDLVLGMGAAVFGVARLDSLEPLTDQVVLTGFTTAISFGYKLSDSVIEGITDHPTRTYQYHYRQVNLLLDHIGLRLAGMITRLGGKAFPVPSSQIVDWQNLRGHLSHKMIARLAGLGWIGRNNLLVHPRFGSRLRLASVLTDIELPFDSPMEEDCGSCYHCVSVCPGRAIGETPESFDLKRCIETIDRVRKIDNIGSHICGICVKACPGPVRK